MTVKVKPSEFSDLTAKAFRDRVMDVLFNFSIANQVASPSSNPTITVSETTGNLTGIFSYSVTYYTADGETARAGETFSVTADANEIELTDIPISSDSTVIGRRIYRNASDVQDLVIKQLVIDIADNTTTSYTDNIADESLGAYVPQMNDTGYAIYNGDNRVMLTGSYGTLCGLNAMPNNTGYANSAFGTNSLTNNTIGYRNSSFGMFSSYYNTIGYNNTSMGVHASNNNEAGYNNCSFGYTSLQYGVDGNNNSGFGVGSLRANGGASNSAFGHSASLGNTGNYNSSFGANSLEKNTTGDENSVFGKSSFYSNVTGSGNVGLGFQSGFFETGSDKLFIDNRNRGSEAAGRLGALIYGEFGNTVAGQLFRVNANIEAKGVINIAENTLVTTPISGHIESDGTNIYWTDNTGTRNQLNN